MSEKNVKGEVIRNVRKFARKRISEDMPIEMSKNMPERMSEDIPEKGCQKKDVRKMTSENDVRRYVRKGCQKICQKIRLY